MASRKFDEDPQRLHFSEARRIPKLRRAEHPWIRPLKLDVSLCQTERETQELFRKFVSILNKLTPQKFETLANQALQLPVDTEEHLNGCTDRIFVAVCRGPHFSAVYAQLCKVLSRITIDVGTGPESAKKNFRSLLLTKCQQEFEKNKESDDTLTELRKRIKEAATPLEKKQLEEELESKDYQVRHDYLAIVRFIGELFKIKMLSEGIMHECIRRLLQSSRDEEALECFVKLMFTVGKDLDHERGHGLMRQYMSRVDSIIKAEAVSPRIRYLLLDVLELRNSNWVPRRESNAPKKIDQLHEEAEAEDAEMLRQFAIYTGSRIGRQKKSRK